MLGKFEKGVVLMTAFAACGWVLYNSAPHGIGITPDSVHYVSAAKNLARTGSLFTYTNMPLVSFAPLLPTLYAIGYLTGFPGETMAVVVNVISFALILVITALWLGHFVKGVPFAGSMMGVLLAKPLLVCALYAWSEIPFVMLCLGALYSVWRYVHLGGKSAWWIACAVGALCPLMRYIGTSVTLCCSIFLLAYPYQTLRRRVLLAMGYLLATSLPFILWLARNKVVSGTIMGVRERSDYAWKDILWDTLQTWHGWFVPLDFARSRTLLVLAGGILVVATVALIARDWRQAPQPHHAVLFLVGLFVVVYGAQLMWSAATVRFDNLDTRFWTPVAVPLVIIGSAVAYVGRCRGTLAIPLTLLVVFLGLGWGISGVAYARDIITGVQSAGIPNSVRTPEWRHSETVEYLRKHQLKGAIYTNAGPEIFYLAGISARWLPYKGMLKVAWENDVRRWDEFVAEVHRERSAGNRVYVVWMVTLEYRSYLYNVDTLRKAFDVSLQTQLADGTVLVVKPLPKRADGSRQP